MRRRRSSRSIAAACALFCGAPATLYVPNAQALVLGTCAATAGGVAFGTYDPTNGAALATTATISVSCLNVLAVGYVTIALSTGTSNAFAARSMSTSGGSLTYNLYQDVANTIIWGDGTGGSQTENLGILALGSFTATTTVYGTIPALQDPVPGSYTDTITVTVSY